VVKCSFNEQNRTHLLHPIQINLLFLVLSAENKEVEFSVNLGLSLQRRNGIEDESSDVHTSSYLQPSGYIIILTKDNL
jgi:hypothetical protein